MSTTGTMGATGRTALLRAHNLRKEYGQRAALVRAVDRVDLDVEAGETLAVMGPSGCGKSTLLHLLGGVDRPTSGEVWLAGRRLPPYPNVCYGGGFCEFDFQGTSFLDRNTGLLWITEAGARRLATPAAPLSYWLELKLRDPASAPAFVSAHNDEPVTGAQVTAWQTIAAADGLLVADQQTVLLVGSWLLGLLSVARVAVLAGGRLAEQRRRVGLLKAVGGTPALVGGVLLFENVALALVAAAAGLLAGWLLAPIVTGPGAGLIGTAGAPSLTLSTVGLVVAVALGVTLAATLVSVIRAARTSTVDALADAARPPRRRARLIALSARLPVPLLLGLRLAARRPRRLVLSAFSVAITVTMIVAVLAFHAGAPSVFGRSPLRNPVVDGDERMLFVVTLMLVLLAALNAVFITWATVLDTRRPLALARALGATPRQVSAGLSAAQLLPALPAIIVGIPAGIGLFAVANGASLVFVPPASWLVAVVLGTLLVVAALTTVPARIGARRPVVEVLQSERA